MSYFVYRLTPPRPSFDEDMSEAEVAIMTEHAAYWQGYFNETIVVVFRPVSDPSGSWGLAVVEAGTEEKVRALIIDDPAIASGMATFEVLPMAAAIARP